jgi:hypothetical protein
MYCPRCGSGQSDELKFCKSCGANLAAVRLAVSKPETAEKFDWNKTWLAEMLLSGDESVKRAAEIERLQGITPEVKRRNEIKAGVITASVGLGVMILLFVLMNGIILSGRVSDGAAEILSRIWVAGVIPLFVGAALIFNGIVVSNRRKELPGHETDTGLPAMDSAGGEYLPPADTSLIVPAGFSVTDETTRHLEKPAASATRTAGQD